MTEWKDIPGYEGLYQASNDGQIRTCYGKVTSNARYAKRVWKQRILKQKYGCRRSTNGTRKGKKDARVSLWKDGKERTFLVSRLIASAWCDGYQDGMTVNHIDGNPENNHCENLEWVSIRENIQKGFADGLFRKSQIPITLTLDDGTEMNFPSLSSAERYLGKRRGYFSDKLKRAEKKGA